MSNENEPLRVCVNGEWRTIEDSDLGKAIKPTGWVVSLNEEETTDTSEDPPR